MTLSVGNSYTSLSVNLLLKEKMTSSSNHIGKIQPFMFKPPEPESCSEPKDNQQPYFSQSFLLVCHTLGGFSSQCVAHDAGGSAGEVWEEGGWFGSIPQPIISESQVFLENIKKHSVEKC